MALNTTRLKQLRGGRLVKQADRSSTFSFLLKDSRGNDIDLNKKVARIVLYNPDSKKSWEGESEVTGSLVSFKLPGNLLDGKYLLEIECEGYVFPSDYSWTITVNKGYTSFVDGKSAEAFKIDLKEVEKRLADKLDKSADEISKELNDGLASSLIEIRGDLLGDIESKISQDREKIRGELESRIGESKEEIKQALEAKADKSEIPNLDGYVKEDVLENLASKEETTRALGLKADKSELADYAKKEEVETKADREHEHEGYVRFVRSSQMPEIDPNVIWIKPDNKRDVYRHLVYLNYPKIAGLCFGNIKNVIDDSTLEDDFFGIALSIYNSLIEEDKKNKIKDVDLIRFDGLNIKTKFIKNSSEGYPLLTLSEEDFEKVKRMSNGNDVIYYEEYNYVSIEYKIFDFYEYVKSEDYSTISLVNKAGDGFEMIDNRDIVFIDG